MRLQTIGEAYKGLCDLVYNLVNYHPAPRNERLVTAFRLSNPDSVPPEPTLFWQVMRCGEYAVLTAICVTWLLGMEILKYKGEINRLEQMLNAPVAEAAELTPLDSSAGDEPVLYMRNIKGNKYTISLAGSDREYELIEVQPRKGDGIIRLLRRHGSEVIGKSFDYNNPEHLKWIEALIQLHQDLRKRRNGEPIFGEPYLIPGKAMQPPYEQQQKPSNNTKPKDDSNPKEQQKNQRPDGIILYA